jgi:hypothetical protein
MKTMETDPKDLANLIADDDIGERIWNPDELADILKHQLTAPLHVDLSRVGGAAGRLRELAEGRGLVLKSFGDLLRHPQPPVALLKLMKDFAKACRLGRGSALPREISSVIYFTSIIAAMTRCSRRITRLDDNALRAAIEWALAQPWLDETSRAVFTEGRQFLAGHAGGRHSTSQLNLGN